jgi:hypothetical protein
MLENEKEISKRAQMDEGGGGMPCIEVKEQPLTRTTKLKP